MLSKTRFVLIVVIVVVAVSGLLLMTSHPAAPAMNEKIEITRTLVGDWTGPSIQYGMTGLVTVHNIGSVAVEIATITVQKIAYSYSPTSAPGKFSAPSNQIAPGQSVTFKITCDPTTPIIVNESGNVNWMVVTKRGTEATFRESEF